jgi:hypothetical protein
MNKLLWILVCLALAFVISSVFFGGNYIRSAGEKLGINIDKVADLADSFRLDRFMAEKGAESRDNEKRNLGN